MVALVIRVTAARVPWSCDLNILFKDLAQVMNMSIYISCSYMSTFVVNIFKEIRMSGACGTHGKRKVRYTEFRGKKRRLGEPLRG